VLRSHSIIGSVTLAVFKPSAENESQRHNPLCHNGPCHQPNKEKAGDDVAGGNIQNTCNGIQPAPLEESEPNRFE
jgi:hypothetical protein